LNDLIEWPQLPLADSQLIMFSYFRDAMSGGYVSVYHVHADGWTKVSMDDCQILHEQYEAAKGNK